MSAWMEMGEGRNFPEAPRWAVTKIFFGLGPAPYIPGVAGYKGVWPLNSTGGLVLQNLPNNHNAHGYYFPQVSKAFQHFVHNELRTVSESRS